MGINPSQLQENLWKDFIKQIQQGKNISFENHWKTFTEIYSDRKETDGPPPAWFPNEEKLKNSNIAILMNELGFSDFKAFHQWTTRNRPKFWQLVIERLPIIFKSNPKQILGLISDVKNPNWFPEARLNCVDSCFQSSGSQTAILSKNENSKELITTSYAELEKLVNRVANGLVENNFQKDDAIALYMPMTVECVAAYLAIIKSGCRVVSIADSFSAEELSKRLEISQSKAIITIDSYSRAGKNINVYNKVKKANSPPAIIIHGEYSVSSIREDDILWADFISNNEKFESAICSPYDVINILFSSGTTGDPKAIPWTHLTPIKCAMDGHYHQDIRHGNVVCWPTNIGWMMGPWLIFATFVNRGTMALYEGSPGSEGFIKFVHETKVNMLGVIPSIVRAWRSMDLVKRDDWTHINVFSSTGEPSNREDYLWLMSRTRYKAPVIEYLGGTEIGGGHITGTVVQPASPATFSTAALGMDFILLDENNNPVNEGENGELFLIPPSIGLSQELLNKNHDKTYFKDCPVGPDKQVLRRHGDQMARLYNGYFKAQGRADDTMNLGGIKVSSLELETIINQHEFVYESAAIAVQPNGEGQEKLVVFIIPQKEISAKSLKNDLNKLIAQKVNPLFKVFDLIIKNKLPRTASNKLMRRVLRDEFIFDN